MPTYAAIFIDSQGCRRSEHFEARDRHQLKQALRAKSLWLVSAQEMKASRKLTRLTIPVRDFVPLLHQLELQLRAGVTADLALAQLAGDAPPGAIHTVLSHLCREVSQGQSIHQACRTFPRLFPLHLRAVIAAGEVSAQLPESLRALAAHLTSIDSLRRTARRALIYPAIVLTATAGLVIFLLGSVVPRFAEIFTSLHLALPLITVVLIRTSELMHVHTLALLTITIALGFAFAVAAHSPALRRRRDALLLKIPLWGDVIRHLATARFAAHGRLLHEAGVPLLDALTSGAELTGHAVLANQLLAARDAVAAGRPLYAALPKGHAFPPFMIPALKAGETTGQLGAALRHIEDYASTRARERLTTALALLEPVVMALLAAVVGAIALSFFLPLVSLLGSVNPH
ncbi:type II secretion system F family protein [Termitidicoccus mucosus]|uniref:Type II secretion system protein GspF domain-containing protein n=1 Tax=Termitidicoccus mucosus TaxID=1184151 RepID=A0A178ICI4_9BACT|nr:hypothetical protein AW736_24000 [Opitutaceae bacterium TSB47]